MAAMIGTGLPGGRAATVLLCAVTTATTCAGCSQTIGGTATAGSDVSSAVSIPLPQLLIDQSRFPPDYPAVVLDPTAAREALRAIDEVPTGSTVTPADCAPATPGEVAAIVGDRGDSTLRVVLVRADVPLSTRRDQLARCPVFTVDTADASSEVTVELLPPPALAVDDAFAVEQTTTGSAAHTGLTLAGEVGDVWVIAYLTGADEGPDTATLDGVFADAVLKVRRAGQS